MTALSAKIGEGKLMSDRARRRDVRELEVATPLYVK
jgi:hypothetical protein